MAILENPIECCTNSDDELRCDINGETEVSDLIKDQCRRATIPGSREEEIVGSTKQVNLKLSLNRRANVETGSATLEIESEGQMEADFSQLSQMFENLFRNVIEHGGDDVTVSVGRTWDGFYVEDTGPGIPEDERDDVLDRGTQQNAKRLD